MLNPEINYKIYDPLDLDSNPIPIKTTPSTKNLHTKKAYLLFSLVFVTVLCIGSKWDLISWVAHWTFSEVRSTT